MGITVITLFEIEIGGPLQTRNLDKVHLTALSIWLVEGINNPDVHPLTFRKDPFIWRVNPEKGDPYFKVAGLEMGMNFLEARDLLVDVGTLAGRDLLMEDMYPEWYDHPDVHLPGADHTYQVKLTSDGLLTFIGNQENKPILPVALKLDKDNSIYKFIIGSKESESSPYYKFG